MPERPMSFSALAVLHAVARGARYGFDVIDATALPSGTVYPALSRHERDGYLRSSWEDLRRAHDEKRPPRKYYALTPEGVRALNAALGRYRALKPIRGLEPALADLPAGADLPAEVDLPAKAGSHMEAVASTFRRKKTAVASAFGRKKTGVASAFRRKKAARGR
jgi:DNA-binding PadR family transcriptional regulator